MKLKITYILNQHIRWIAFEWIALNYDRSKFDIDFILVRNTEGVIATYFEKFNIPFKKIPIKSKEEKPQAIATVAAHLIENKTDIVHTHFAGNFVGLTAAEAAGVPVRMYTRHHAGIIKRKDGWIEPGDLRFTNLATHVVAINERAKKRMLYEGIPEEKIAVVPHGFDLAAFENLDAARIKNVHDKYLPPQHGPVIGVVSRYVEIKGIEYTIEAFKEVLKKHPDAILVLAGAFDYYAKEIKAHLSTLPENSYVEIYFEDDLFALFQLFDVFVHVPITPDVEAFGQVYIEAMLSKIPSIITLSGIAHEYAQHQKNCWVVDYKNSEQIKEGILTLLDNQDLRQKIIANAKICGQQYSLKKMMNNLEQLYIETCALAASEIS